MRLFLFDVDGTLVAVRGAGRRAMGRAFVQVFGDAGPIETYDFRGKTDLQIVADVMKAAGFSAAEITARTPAFFERYSEELRSEIGAGERVTLMPGIEELVKGLAGYPGALLGLLTGNTEDGARIKLAPTGLWPHFRLGAYGSDDHDRSRLPALAVRRAESLVGHAIQEEQVVVVGDTPLDVACARAYGAVAVAVATGQHPLAELAASEPDLLFPDLSDVPQVLPSLLNGVRLR